VVVVKQTTDTDQVLLDEVVRTVHMIEPDATVILYGSRARGEASADSDWDFLILVDGTVDGDRVDHVRHALYRIEVEANTVLSAIVRNRQAWNDSSRPRTPFRVNVEREGIVL